MIPLYTAVSLNTGPLMIHSIMFENFHIVPPAHELICGQHEQISISKQGYTVTVNREPKTVIPSEDTLKFKEKVAEKHLITILSAYAKILAQQGYTPKRARIVDRIFDLLEAMEGK